MQNAQAEEVVGYGLGVLLSMFWRDLCAGDPVALDGYIGTSDRFVEAIADFAVDYADQTEADYKTFLHSRFAPPAARKAPMKAAPRWSKVKQKTVIQEAAPKA